MDKLEKLDSLLLQGRITKEEYNEQKALFADKIITHLESELAEAYELHDQAKGKDAHESFFYLVKATLFVQLLEKIKE